MVGISMDEPDWNKITETIKSHDFKHLDIQDSTYDNISISVDYDTIPEEDRFVSILFTPNMENKNEHDFVEHYHIKLEDDSAVKLYNWLQEYLTEKELI